jgi:cell division transport system permease protein
LRATKGIVRVEALSDADTRALVEPWLGSGALLKELPLPRLVDATLEPGVRIDIAALARRLKSLAPDSVLDDHARWLARLKRTAETLIWSAWAILALIAVATAAAVTFATRASLSAHHEIVWLLHQMGARAGFVARTFEWHYCASALAASLIGAALAGALFAATGILEQAGLDVIPLLPPLNFGPFDLVWLLAVPAAAGLIALATARASVLGVLGRYY